MKAKWMKHPSWVNWKEINKQFTKERREAQRKREFIGRLKKGKQWHFTDDPGPY